MRAARTLRAAVAGVDPALRAVLLIFPAVTVPRAGTVPSRVESVSSRRRSWRFDEDTVRVHYVSVDTLARRHRRPRWLFFVALPNFENSPDFQRLRCTYRIAAVKSYERSGYAMVVYTMRRKSEPGRAGGAVVLDRFAR